MRQGRPYSGVAIMWKELQKYIQVLKTPSDRLCAFSIDLGVRTILVVSVYMPCDLGGVTSVDALRKNLGTWMVLSIARSSTAK